MEKNNHKIENVIDIRQSPEWGQYLEFLNWKVFRTNSGAQIAIKDFLTGGLVKVQRPDNLSAESLQELEEICIKNNALYIKIEPAQNQNLKILEKKAYIINGSPHAPPTTLFIDLQKNPDELWVQLSKSAKYSINRANREGAKVEFHKNPNEKKLKEFFDIEKETGTKKRFFVQNFEDLKKKAELFGEHCHIALVYGKDGQLHGGNFFLGFKNNVWFLHGGTSAAGRKTKSGYKLVWDSFEYLNNQGYVYLDQEGKDDDRFPGFTKDWGGFSHFKEKFGGTQIEFARPRIKYLNKFLIMLSKINPKLPL